MLQDWLITERLINCWEILAMKMARWTWTLFVTQQWAMESSFRLLQAGSGNDQLGSSRVCKDARIFMNVASKKFLLFEIQFNHLCRLCAYWNNGSQAIWDTLLWGLAQVIINCTLLLKAHPSNGQVIFPPAKFVCCMIRIKSILKLISTSKMQKLAADVVHTWTALGLLWSPGSALTVDGTVNSQENWRIHAWHPNLNVLKAYFGSILYMPKWGFGWCWNNCSCICSSRASRSLVAELSSIAIADLCFFSAQSTLIWLSPWIRLWYLIAMQR